MSSQALLVTLSNDKIIVEISVIVVEVVVGKSIQLHITCKYLFTPGQGSP
jgi:hypothetical protein